MITKEQQQAIKIEQLKGEWHEERATIERNIVDASYELKRVESKIVELEQRKSELKASIFRDEENLKRAEDHYTLLIKACQTLSGKSTKGES
jgi:predicted  nucleic acid-binding Zn-ribbon protein